jgi:hypothetical protein
MYTDVVLCCIVLLYDNSCPHAATINIKTHISGVLKEFVKN